ncbi:uncharacterized protein LOC129940921 [Eupeodes corollae]|uniref:uncharacterized protein LOC129940921 n=1 Tax=Eupeodes corollae TaxID=290404 RepID=UPI00248F9C8B|nr:uncharacterized protein LOC129940921 [Eupeodes corollae]
MASGPNRTNRYRDLDVEPVFDPHPLKKQKTNPTSLLNFPTLPNKTNLNNPKFIIIAPKNKDSPITNLSPFLLKKAIDNISTEYDQISQLRDGNLLIRTKSQKIAEKFIKINNLANMCPVEIKLHDRLNECKGIAYAPCLINVPETEIVTEMKAQGVTSVYKFIKPDEKVKLRPTGLMLFTFDLFRPPKTIEIGFYNARVSEYVPNPMRCRNCQLLGHTTKRCNGNTKCETCNLPLHTPDDCIRTMCANCSLPHPSSSKDCPSYKQAKEILAIQTMNKCSAGEAKRIYKERNPLPPPTSLGSFSESLRQNIPTQIIDSIQSSGPKVPTSIPTPNPINESSSKSNTTNSLASKSTQIKSKETKNNNSLHKPLVLTNSNTEQTTKSDSKSSSSNSNLNTNTQTHLPNTNSNNQIHAPFSNLKTNNQTQPSHSNPINYITTHKKVPLSDDSKPLIQNENDTHTDIIQDVDM